MVRFVEENMFGESVLTDKKDVDRFIEENYLSEDYREEICKALEEGKDIYHGWVSFEECEYHMADLYHDLWDAIEKADQENFTGSTPLLTIRGGRYEKKSGSYGKIYLRI